MNQYLRFEKVIRFRVNNFNGHNISLSVGKAGEVEQNNIVWRNVRQEEMDFVNLSGFTTTVTKIEK